MIVFASVARQLSEVSEKANSVCVCVNTKSAVVPCTLVSVCVRMYVS